MDLLPAELIDVIGQFLDVTSAVRFSRVCWRIYETTRAHVLKVTRHKLLLDEIIAIKYEVCERDENARKDYYGRYCGVRTYPNGRIVGSISRTDYDGVDADMLITVFFATQVKICRVGCNRESGFMNAGSRDVDIYLNTVPPLLLTRENVTGVGFNRRSRLDVYSTIKMFEDAALYDDDDDDNV
jgi:hypothetical protein